ncbi:MAG: CHASE2 domain-containing protein [Thermodesulfobacteriota bacterium]
MGAHRLRATWLHAVLHGGIAVALSLVLWFSGLFQGIEATTFDLRARLLAEPSPAGSAISLIAVDQESLDWVAENMGIVWPWPRELFGAVIDNCKRRGARAIGFDVLFTEPSSSGVGDDQALVRAIERAGSFALGSVFPTRNNAKFSAWPDALPRPPYAVRMGHGATDILPRYPMATLPVHEIARAATVLCNVHHGADADGIYRRIHPFVLFDGVPLPSLGIGLYLAAHPKALIQVNRHAVIIDGNRIPLDKYGATIPRYRGPHKTHMMHSAAAFIRQEFRLMNGELVPEEIEHDLTGKYVLFGYTAPGLFDLRPSPTDGMFSGMEINATVLDNLLAGDFIRPMSAAWTATLVLLFTSFALAALALIPSLRGRIAVALCFMLLPALIAVQFYKQGFDLTLVPVQFAVAAALAMSIVQEYFMTLRQERFIRHSFKHYLSPAVIDQLLGNPERLKLGGERKELTMFFSDLEGFTRISEGLAPEQLTQLLNEYLTAMTDIILQEEGTVDKFEGDAIIAFWNAPLEIAGHPEKAVRAALRCQARLGAMRDHFLAGHGVELVMRIGINTGHAIAGNMGSASRFDYTVLGDAVNLAARLEGANKYFGTRTMISQATFNQLGSQFHCRELGRLKVVGRREPVTVYEPLSHAGAPAVDYSAFAAGLQHYYAGEFAEAQAAFSRLAGQDPASAMYAKLCARLISAPPITWDGVLILDAK